MFITLVGRRWLRDGLKNWEAMFWKYILPAPKTTQKEVDLLQQILFYRELGISLDEIKSIIWSKNYDSAAAMQKHLVELRARKEQRKFFCSFL